MGRCAKRTKRIVKGIAKGMTPIGMKLIGNIVGLVANTDWSNDEKRERSVEMGKAAIRQAGIDAKEYMIRASVEAAVAALKEGESALQELGAPDDDDVIMIDTDDDGIPDTAVPR